MGLRTTLLVGRTTGGEVSLYLPDPACDIRALPDGIPHLKPSPAAFVVRFAFGR